MHQYLQSFCTVFFLFFQLDFLIFASQTKYFTVMRKLFLFLLFLLPFVGSAGEPETIPLSIEDKFTDEDNRNETGSTSFSAQLINNNLVKVQSTEISTFEVRILDVEDNSVCYGGSTTYGILHITTSSLSVGHYILNIKGDGFIYVGEFIIGN